MRRWFVLFLMAVLSLQFSWAAAATYCEHESSPDAAHFGHHQHALQAADDAPGHDDVQDRSIALEDICAVCHLGHAGAWPTTVIHVDPPASPYWEKPARSMLASHIPDLPERPDRPAA